MADGFTVDKEKCILFNKCFTHSSNNYCDKNIFSRTHHNDDTYECNKKKLIKKLKGSYGGN